MAEKVDAESVFAEAIQIASPLERAAYLDRVCQDDPGLRQEVEKLVVNHFRAGDFLEKPVAQIAAPTLEQSVAERPVTQIGRYLLLQEIGEGGMGVVYMAEQKEPVERRVALKIIKPGMDTRQVIARFEAERQALATMDHPNIAKVLDAGATDSGRPYFVMELVNGIPVTQFCDEQQLTARERLELFIPICRAVQHAHHKGVIHRDIKPSNLLVALYDGRPVPKVIDFGVGKAINPLTDESLFTGLGQIVGTIEYMSPEQAQRNQLDIDTRSDVYSLGVVLYELLTGDTPFDKPRLRSAGIDEVLRIIREEEPTRPSAKLSSSDTLTLVAANRRIEPKKLCVLLRGELDWIVMKALEKDRDRRYETANALTMDIECYLADQAVQACPPSAGYRLRKILRRNKGPVLAVVLLLLALIGGMIGTTWGMLRAQQARHAETKRAEGERLAKLDADQARQAEGLRAEGERLAKVTAEKRLAQIEKGIDLLGSIFKDLDPRAEEKEGKQLRVLLGERLDQATKELEGESIGDSLAVARLQMTLGESQLGLGYFDKAIALFTKARATYSTKLGPNHPDTLESMNNLARGNNDAGNLDLALLLFEQTLKLRKSKLGPDHPDTLVSMNNLAGSYQAAGKLDLALPLFEESLKVAKAKLAPNHRDTLFIMNNLAECYQAVGKLDLALPMFEETFKLLKAKCGPNHRQTLYSKNSLALAYKDAGKLDLALPIFEETLELTRATLGSDHPDTLRSMNCLAGGYHVADKPELAVPLFEQVVELRKAKLGHDHPSTLTSMGSLAAAYEAAGKLDLALPLFAESLKLQKAKCGPNHPNTLICMNNLAFGYKSAGKLDLAVPLFEETLRLVKAKHGPDHPDTLACMSPLASCYLAVGKNDLALPLFEETLKFRKAKQGPNHPDTIISTSDLALCYLSGGKNDLALPLLEETVKLRKAKQGPDHRQTLSSMSVLASCYLAVGKNDLALPLFEETVKLMKANLGPNHPEVAAALAPMGLALLQQKQFAAAEPPLRECLAIRENTQPDAWTTFNTKSLLGRALSGQTQYTDAESLLLAGYNGMKAREETIPPVAKIRLTEALERLVQLYEAWGKPDEAAKWQQKLDEAKNAGTPPSK